MSLHRAFGEYLDNQHIILPLVNDYQLVVNEIKK